MSSKKIKLLESAQKNFLKGLYDKAIAEYRQIILLDPADIRHRQRLAEILTKANQKDEAIKEYTSLAKHYVDTVHYLKAIAVYKQIQKLDPSNPDISLTLASLNEKQGLIGNATAEYASAVHIYESSGENLKALKALEAMLAIDPSNYAVRLRVAEKYFSTGREDQAAREFVALACDLQERCDENGFLHVSEKIHLFFKEKAVALFAQINETIATTDSVEEQPQAAAQTEVEQLPSESFHPEEVPATAVAPPVPAEIPVDHDDDIELIEDIQPLDDIEEIDEMEDTETVEAVSTSHEFTDWEEDIDLDALAPEVASVPDSIPDEANDALLKSFSELEDIELELEIVEDEQPEYAAASADLQLPDMLPPDGEDSFDLGKELSFFTDEIDFDLITAAKGDTRFELDSPSGFMKSELDKEDAESHYSLGLAYREMGLFDEAISEFIVAAHSAERKVDCQILQGVCFRESGEIGKALEILTATLHEPELNEDKILGIKYELGVCHEAVDEKAEAKKLYSEILAIRPDFSDTASRLLQL